MHNLLRLLAILAAFALACASARADNICNDNSSTASSGSLTDSGGAGSNYSNNENCSFLIQPTGGGTITLSFSSFNYESGFDEINVYDGTSTSGTFLGSFSGSSLPADLTATSGAMLIVNSTDFSVTRSGFQASWTTGGGGGCPAQFVADNFNSVSYNQNNGTQNWATDWLEVGESNGTNSGIARVRNDNCSSGNCLRLGVPSGNSAQTYNNIGVQREVDLSGATTATLTFNYRTGYAAGTPLIRLWVSNNGGASWVFLQQYSFFSSSFSDTTQTFDLTPYISNNTRIRFLADGSAAVSGFYVDNINISHDGSNCPTPTPIAEWRFDESAWSNAANQVQDSSANNYHGNAFNGANTQSSSPALVGDPGTCGYGNFDGDNDHIRLPSSFPNLSGSFTVSGWINARELGNDQRIFADDKNNSGGFAFSLGDGGNGKLRFFSRSVSPVIVDTQNAVITQNNWIFVAAVHDATAKTRQIYVNGTAVALNTGGTSSTYTGNWGTDSGQASIGGEINSAGSEANANWRFNGLIDEMRVYEDALTAAQIQTIMAERHACPAVTTDHLAISHSGSAVTCAPETITLRAHQSNHTIDTSYSQTVNLSTSTSRGDWSLISGSGSLNNGTANDGAASYSFAAGDNGSVQLGLKNTTIEILNINVSDGSISETSGSATANEDQNLSFAETGLRFLASGTAGAIGTQIAGKIARTPPNAQALELQAIRTSPDTGACEAALIDSHNIDMAFECQKPATCTSNRVSINSINIGANNNGSVTTYVPVSMNFGDATDNSADFIFNYPDAGQIRLHARYNLPLANGNPSGNYITGSSNSFVVKPGGLCVEATEANADCLAGNVSCSLFKKAGETFNLRLKAVVWQSFHEANEGFCDGNATTPNFRLDNIALSSLLIAPSPGANATLGVTSFNMSAGDNGEHNINNQNVSEVGVFFLSATPPSYLGTSIAASSSAPIGRFYPDHLTVSNGLITEACNSGNFSYLGQAFTTTATVTAKNVSGATTTNYRDSFAQLSTPLATPGDANSLSFGAINSTVPTLLSSRLNHTSTSFTWHNNGTGTLISNLTLARLGAGSTNIDGPFAAQIGVLPIDADGVTVRVADRNLDSNNASPNDHVLIDTSDQRYGRIVIDNAFGPEVLDLQAPVRAEYWNGSAFTINSNDNACPGSQFVVGDFIISDADGSDSLTPASLSSLSYQPLVSGSGSLTLGAPNASGPLNITLNLADWLKFDFDGNNSDDNPAAQAIFGQYRGNDRIIYWREQF